MKTTIFRDTPAICVALEEMPDGQCHIRKTFSNAADCDEEWAAMRYLYDEGFNVPKLYKKDGQSMYMQYIYGGTFVDMYKAADTAAQHGLMQKFVKLLYDLHHIKPKDKPPFDGFISNELAAIKTLIEKKQMGHCKDIFDKLQNLSARIQESPYCYIHRDYHVWNVLSGKDEKLYLIDMTLTQGDYRFDVGWTYMLMKRSAVHDAGYAGFAQAFLSGYFALKPEARENIEFFKQLANLRWLANVTPDNKADKPWFPEMMAAAEREMTAFLLP